MDVLFRIKSAVAVPTEPSTHAVPPLAVSLNHVAVLVLPAVALLMALAVSTDGWADDDAGAKGDPMVSVAKST